MNIQDWFPLGWTGWISLKSKGLSRVFSNTIVQKHQFFSTPLSFYSPLSHPYMTAGKTIALTRWIFVGKVMCLLFNMLSRLVIAFLPRSKCLLISWLQSLCVAGLIFHSPKIQTVQYWQKALSRRQSSAFGQNYFVFDTSIWKVPCMWNTRNPWNSCWPGWYTS